MELKDISRFKEVIAVLNKINKHLEGIEKLLTPDEPSEEEVRKYLNRDWNYDNIPPKGGV